MGRKEDLTEKCRNYNPDEDPTGAIGHSLADARIKEFPEKYNFPLVDDFTPAEKWEEFYEIIENSNPKKIYNEPGMKKKLKGVFGKLKRAGMRVRDYSNMQTVQMWNYFCKLRKDINSHCV